MVARQSLIYFVYCTPPGQPSAVGRWNVMIERALDLDPLCLQACNIVMGRVERRVNRTSSPGGLALQNCSTPAPYQPKAMP